MHLETKHHNHGPFYKHSPCDWRLNMQQGACPGGPRSHDQCHSESTGSRASSWLEQCRVKPQEAGRTGLVTPLTLQVRYGVGLKHPIFWGLFKPHFFLYMSPTLTTYFFKWGRLFPFPKPRIIPEGIFPRNLQLDSTVYPLALSLRH